MTAFLLFDELERDFEPLEEHPARHAAALAMYSLIGQKCAQRMTDGVVPAPLIAKTFAAWPDVMVSTATSDLVVLGKWVRADDGSLHFADWELTQTTRERETARREKNAERQRARRERTKGKSANVTRDVPRDVTPPSPSPSPSPDPDPSSLRSEGEKRASARPQVSGGHVQEFSEALRAEAWARDETPPELPNSQLLAAARRAKDYADRTGKPYAEAARALARTGLEHAKAAGKDLGFILGTVEPGSPLPAARTRGRPERARATTGADFEDAEDFETQLARIGGNT